MRLRLVSKTIALVGVLLVVAAACSNKTPTTGGASASASASTAPQGGSIVVGAEQWPDCVNPITTGCSSLTWYWYTVAENILPYLMVIDTKGNFVPSSNLVEAPTLDNGGISQNPFTITYKLKPGLKWADGTAMTSADVDFTWKATLNTPKAYVTAGYDQIDSIDTTDPTKAVIKFKTTYVDWQDLFGGVYQGFYEKAAFPTADPNKPNLEKEMQTSVPFSGGPWQLKSWSKDQAVLIRNPNFSGHVSNLDQVTMVPREDLTTEVNVVLTGEVAAVYPQPGAASILQQVAGNPNVKAVGADGAYYDAMWFNVTSPPLDDPKVREALSYAIDRQSIEDAIVHKNAPNSQVLNCGALAVPNVGPWCDPVFAQFTYDPAKAISILTADGYDCSKVPNSPCTKNGKDLVVNYRINAPNTRRAATQELLKEKVKPAGFALNIKNSPDSGTYFGADLPNGNFTMADYATGGSPDPSVTSSLGCDAIPSKANGFGGANWSRWCNKQADALMRQSDTILDPGQRLTLMKQIYELEAPDNPFLPLYVLPNVGLWRTDQIAGPIADYIPSNLGMFFNMNEWFKGSA